MNKSKFSGLIFIIYSFFGCDSTVDNEQRTFTKQTYYDNGLIRAEAIFNSDSLKHGWGRLYYENGTPELEIEYLNGKKEGEEKKYYESGQLKYIGYNKYDQPIGELIDYNEQGQIIHYKFYDPAGRGRYKAIYSNNEIVKEEGDKKLFLVVKTLTDYNFKSGDTLNIQVYAPTPPNTNNQLKFKIIDEENQITEEENLVLKHGVANFSKRLTKTGEFILRSELTYNSDSSNIVESIHYIVSE